MNLIFLLVFVSVVLPVNGIFLSVPGLCRTENLPKLFSFMVNPVRAQVVEQRVLDARDHGVDNVVCFFLGGQTQSLLNPQGQLVPAHS